MADRVPKRDSKKTQTGGHRVCHAATRDARDKSRKNQSAQRQAGATPRTKHTSSRSKRRENTSSRVNPVRTLLWDKKTMSFDTKMSWETSHTDHTQRPRKIPGGAQIELRQHEMSWPVKNWNGALLAAAPSRARKTKTRIGPLLRR
jgi:hypothetical protein